MVIYLVAESSTFRAMIKTKENGRRLKAARNAQRRTLEEIGLMLDPNLSKQSVHKMETGKKIITLELATQLSKILDISIEDIVDPDAATEKSVAQWKTVTLPVDQIPVTVTAKALQFQRHS